MPTLLLQRLAAAILLFVSGVGAWADTVLFTDDFAPAGAGLEPIGSPSPPATRMKRTTESWMGHGPFCWFFSSCGKANLRSLISLSGRRSVNLKLGISLSSTRLRSSPSVLG